MAVLDLNPLEVDGGGHSPVQGVALLGLGPHAEHGAPGVRNRVELHHPSEAHVLVLVEGPGVGDLVGVVYGEGAAPAVVDVAGVARGRAWKKQRIKTTLLY